MKFHNAATLAELRAALVMQQQIGYETIKGDASVGWLRLGALALALAALAALLINRRLPTSASPAAPAARESNLAAISGADFSQCGFTLRNAGLARAADDVSRVVLGDRTTIHP